MLAFDDKIAPADEAAAHTTAPGVWRNVLLFPLTRLVVALVFLATGLILRDVIANGVLALPPDAIASRALVLIVAVSAAYVAYVRLVERRRAREFALQHAPRELSLGMLLGACVILMTAILLWMLGSYQVTGISPWSVLLVPLVTAAATALREELVFRGIVFRIMEEGLGTWAALVFSAASFGLLHLGNENASVFGAVSTAATAGVFLAGVYILTRRLWLAIGAHYAVNLAQGPILGLPVSGREHAGLVQSALHGPELLTGGTYGVEASVITAALGVALASYVVRLAYLKGRFVGPLWTRGDGFSTGGIVPELRNLEDERAIPLESPGV